MSYHVLTAIGRDRPGIVERVTGFLHERGANIEDSRMAALGGEFAAMLLFQAPEEQSARIEADLAALEAENDLSVTVRATSAPGERPRGPAIPLRVEAVALDHPGIVHEVSRELRDLGVNIETLTTRVRQAPVSGSPLFEMRLDVSVPATVQISRVRAALEEVADRLNLDLSVHRLTD